MFAISNFWNVASNLPFLAAGLWGLVVVRRYGGAVCLPGLEPAYVVFFAGIALTALGSSYYHLNPQNGPLFWDRLPMTFSIAGLFSIIVGEFVSVRSARRLLVPLLTVGVASVVYWAFTEARGTGDLRPYAIVQFLPMLLVPVILLVYAPAIGAKKYYWLMLLFYGVAKLVEYLDAAIFATGGIISGHTLKHLFGALIPATMLYALMLRRAAQAGASGD